MDTIKTLPESVESTPSTPRPTPTSWPLGRKPSAAPSSRLLSLRSCLCVVRDSKFLNNRHLPQWPLRAGWDGKPLLLS